MYYVLNRGVGRMQLFEDDADYSAFERMLHETIDAWRMRIRAYCLISNHWHLDLGKKRGRDSLLPW